MTQTDFVVIGAGMAGASVAYELADSARVVVIERETHPGYHATGRSAAVFSEIYGSTLIRALSRASRKVLFDPPSAFSEAPFVRRRGAMFIATAERQKSFEQFRSLPDIARGTHLLTMAEATELVPVLRPESTVFAAHEPSAMDIEVHGLHQSYIKGFRARGGTLLCDCDAQEITRVGRKWRVETSRGAFEADVVINAAGAWADDISQKAGVAPLQVRPARRTALLFDPPAGLEIDGWPVVIDIDETFYFKPDAGKILLSPADETLSPPCDAQPEDLDIAIAVDRLEQATTLTVRRVTYRWAGLRSFSPDRSPIVGFDSSVEGFFWLAGQGGYGIQSAPALARTAAALALGQAVPTDIAAQGVSATELSPLRFDTNASPSRVTGS